MIKVIVILGFIVVSLIGTNILSMREANKQKKVAKEAINETKKIKRNITSISETLVKDQIIVKGGKTIGKSIKKAKTDDEAHDILLNLSHNLDGLL